MTEEEAYSTFVSRLKPHLASQVGAHTPGELLVTQAMAERLDHYTTSTKEDAGPSGGSGITGGRSLGRGTRGGATQRKGSLMQWKRNQLTQGVNLEVAREAKEGDKPKAKEMPSSL